MAAETVDTLEIEIRSRANEAANKVEALATSLSNFGSNISKYLGDLKSFASVMEQIASAAQKLGAISNLKSILGSVGKAARTGKVEKLAKEAEAAAKSPRAPIQVRNKSDEERRAEAQLYRQSVAGFKDRVRSARAESQMDVARRWLAENTPEKIMAQRATFGQNKLGDQWQELFGNRIPAMADKYRDMGLIDENTAQAMKEAAGFTQQAADNAERLNGASQMTAEQFANTVNQTDLLQMKLEATGAKLEEALHSDEKEPGKIAKLTEEYQRLQEKIENVGEAMKETKSEGFSLRGVLTDVGDRIKHSVVGQLMRVAKMRVLRSVVKALGAGLKEGLENLYAWSDKLNGHFAGAMDTAASKIMLMKNAIATALSPAIEALIPVLEIVVNWVRIAANAVAQFMSLITGQESWTMALETAEKWGDNTSKKVKGATKATKDADKAAKDLLADWDELNIIQGETTGSGSTGGSSGGGTSKKLVDTSKMFKEMNEFDRNLTALVNNLKEKFGSIKNLVLEIGAAVLAWKASEIFAGTLGTLSALVGTGVILDLVFKLSETFTGTYLDTGNEGWLVADLLTPLVGGAIAGFMLKQVNAFGLAKYSLPIAFAVSAVATITAVVEDKDVSALNERSVKALLIAATEGAVALGFFSKLALGKTGIDAMLYGASGALITFGVGISIKAIADTIDTGEITAETIKADVIGALSTGAGFAIIAAEEGAGLAGTIATGVGAAFLTFGVSIGLQAVAKVKEDGKITEESLLAEVGGSALIGAGVALLTGGTLALAGGIAVATFGLLVAIDAIVMNDRPKKILWGNSELTDEEIQRWVSEKMFRVNVTATIEKIQTVISGNKTLRDSIAESMVDVNTDLNLIKLGLADEDTYESMRVSLFGADGNGGGIKRLKDYAAQQEVTIKTSMTLLPLINENGKEDKAGTADALKAGMTGWSEVNKYMTTIGGELAEALKGGTKNGLKTYDDELIATLTEKLANVQQAVTGAQLSSRATGNLLTNLSGLSQGDAQGIVDAFAAYKQELEDGYNDILKEELSSYQSLAAFYRARGEEGDDVLANYYDGLVQNLIDQWLQRLKNGVESAIGPGKQAIAEAFSKMFKLSPEDIKGANAFNKPMVQSLMGVLQSTIGNNDMKYTPEVKEAFTNWLDEVLKASLTEGDYNIISSSLKSGILSYTDLFSQEAIDLLTSGWQGDNNPYKQVIQSAWAEMLGDALGEKPEKAKAKVELPAKIPVQPKNEEPVALESTGLKFEFSSAADAFDTAAWQYMADEEFDEFLQELVDKFGGDEVREALQNLDIPEADIRIPLNTEFDIDKKSGRFNFGNHLLGSAGVRSGVNYTANENLTVDAQASGMAMDATLNNLTGTVNMSSDEITKALAALASIMANVEDYTRATASKDFTVVITPSSAMGDLTGKSNKRRSYVTGDFG